MKTIDAPIKQPISALVMTLLSAVCVTILCANTVSSQTLRRQTRIQRKIDRKASRPAADQNKLTTSNSGKDKENSVTSGEGAGQPEAEGAPRPPKTSKLANLDGIKQRGLS